MSSTVVNLRAALVAALVVLAPATALAQDASVRVAVAEENFRSAPSGTRIAVLLQGTTLAAGEARPQWREATLDAWVPDDAVTATTRDGHDLAIRANGTTLHAAPGGDIVARGLQGFLLDEVSRRDGWVRVTRTGWIWSASIERAPAADAPAATPAAVRPAGAAPAGARTAASTADVPATRTLHAAPGGARLGTVGPDARLEVVGEEGEWSRVRLDAWVRTSAGDDGSPARPLRNLSLRALRDDPEAYRGSTVAWRVQFVAVQRADSLRTDLVPGESYILARDPGGEPGYVYIAVSPELLPAALRLIPLQQVEVVGRVRTGRSEIMGHPVLDLVELRPART